MSRWEQLMREALDNHSLAKWCVYAQHYGTSSVEWHESWYMSPEQEEFFAQYEEQLVSDKYLAQLLTEF